MSYQELLIRLVGVFAYAFLMYKGDVFAYRAKQSYLFTDVVRYTFYSWSALVLSLVVLLLWVSGVGD